VQRGVKHGIKAANAISGHQNQKEKKRRQDSNFIPAGLLRAGLPRFFLSDPF
jgi:hypothetical protein